MNPGSVDAPRSFARSLYVLFFLSGVSGLIYQVVWVRVFGNAFGNTVYSASLVIAVFMLGLGAGSYVAGTWSDRRYLAAPDSTVCLRAYGVSELLVALAGLAVAVVLPHLAEVSSWVSSYSREANGWYSLSASSYLIRALIAVLLLAPGTVLMGGTLTLLIRHLVWRNLNAGPRTISVLYGANTLGAAAGCFLTDFALVPAFGLWRTQLVAVSLNALAGLVALLISRRAPVARTGTGVERPGAARPSGKRAQPASLVDDGIGVTPTALALGLTGFAAMGTEILWLRHFSILLGEYRAVFSLLLAVVLVALAAGSFLGGVLRRRGSDPVQWWIVTQGLFVASTLLGLAVASADRIKAAAIAQLTSHAPGTFEELWFNLRPMLFEVAIPALLMGFAFPLANAVVQRAERAVGHRAGALYLANTIGAVTGSLAAGFLLLPTIGLQGTATVLMIAGTLVLVPLNLAARTAAAAGNGPPPRRGALVASGLAVLAVFGWWLQLPSNFVLSRAMSRPAEGARILALREGVNEVVAITEGPAPGRTLYTNGHPMSSTEALSQRYMRALAHVPLLLMDRPEAVLVMCFGVGNTAHAATLHPSVRRVDIADLSRHVLESAGYFADANHDVLKDPRVAVYVDDGRQHLQMQPEGSYDLVTLEPPPVTQVGMGSLYSREFYRLVRARLKPDGYISQWLPLARVPQATTLAMVRAFIDVFPNAVLVSGAPMNLLLLGINGPRLELDPAAVTRALSRAPAVEADLGRLELGSARDIAATFVASARTLAEATREAAAVTDDLPVQEYAVRSLLNLGEPPAPSLVDVSQIAAWCPKCFADGRPVPLVDGLDTYLALLDVAYRASPAGTRSRGGEPRLIAGSAYLGAILPESAEVQNILGTTFAAKGDLNDAISAFREALRLDPDSAAAHRNLGSVLSGPEEAMQHLRRAIELNPNDGQARYELATRQLESGRYEDAAAGFGAAIRLMPGDVKAYNNLGVALASQGKLEDAVAQFRRALALNPGFADAQRNLSAALRQRQSGGTPH